MRYVGIDLSSKTGFVSLDGSGNILEAMEITSDLTGAARMSELTRSISGVLKPNDVVAIEGFSYGSKGRGVDFQYGLGWLIRTFLFESGFAVIEASPSQVKQFSGAKGNANKNVVMREVYKRWGFEHDSDNVIDAYILAQMSRLFYLGNNLPVFQKDLLTKVRILE